MSSRKQTPPNAQGLASSLLPSWWRCVRRSAWTLTLPNETRLKSQLSPYLRKGTGLQRLRPVVSPMDVQPLGPRVALPTLPRWIGIGSRRFFRLVAARVGRLHAAASHECPGHATTSAQVGAPRRLSIPGAPWITVLPFDIGGGASPRGGGRAAASPTPPADVAMAARPNITTRSCPQRAAIVRRPAACREPG